MLLRGRSCKSQTDEEVKLTGHLRSVRNVVVDKIGPDGGYGGHVGVWLVNVSVEN
jgi:hypothetical protein